MLTAEMTKNEEFSLEMLELADDDMEQVSGGYGCAPKGGGYTSSYLHGSLNLEWGFETVSYCPPVCPPPCPPPCPPKYPC
jgi:hypothetical protein